MDQGQTHAEMRSNRVHLPLIDEKAGRRGGVPRGGVPCGGVPWA
jgi:hypothetical protein